MGAGVLGLPNALSWLGWVGGLALMTTFYGVTLYCAHLLIETVDVKGRKARTYREATENILVGGRVSSSRGRTRLASALHPVGHMLWGVMTSRVRPHPHIARPSRAPWQASCWPVCS